MYEVNFLSVLAALLRRIWLVVLIPLALGLFVGVSKLMEQRSYAATSRFAPQQAAARSRVPSVVAQLGINMPQGGATESPAFYQYLLTSPGLLREAGLSTYRVAAAPGSRDSVNMTLLQALGIESGSQEEKLRMLVRRLEGQITTSVDGSAGLVIFTVKAFRPELAVQINRRMLELVQQFNVEQRQFQARSERQFVATQLNDARKELEQAEDELKTFLQQNRRLENSPTLQFESSRLERRILTKQEVFNALSQAFEQARIEEVRNTPVISVVSNPETDVKPLGRRVLISTLLAVIAGFIIAVVAALLLEYFRQRRLEEPESYAEFAAARSHALRRLLTLRLRSAAGSNGKPDAAARQEAGVEGS